jgi:hypothetical protein
LYVISLLTSGFYLIDTITLTTSIHKMIKLGIGIFEEEGAAVDDFPHLMR